MHQLRTDGAAEPTRRNPQRTRLQILHAAVAEFAAKGYGGTRVNEIALRAGANKRMIYHYFGSKDGLFLAVLEHAYATIRSREKALSLVDLEPRAAMERLVVFTFDHFVRHPEFITLVNTENLLGARHLRQSRTIREMHSPLVDSIGRVLARGAGAGLFRAGVDPMQLYISIAALSYFYLSNNHTLSAIFGRDLGATEAQAHRRRHAVEVVLGFLRPDDSRS